MEFHLRGNWTGRSRDGAERDGGAFGWRDLWISSNRPDLTGDEGSEAVGAPARGFGDGGDGIRRRSGGEALAGRGAEGRALAGA